MSTALITVIPSPAVGNVYTTDFTFNVLLTSDASVASTIWDLGDGTLVYNKQTVTHTYNYPGIYTVQLTSTDIVGNIATTFQLITADYAIRDSIVFTQVPDDFANPGVTTNTPFKVTVTTAQISSSLVIDLFAVNSKSVPFQFVPEHWNFLTPTWKFLDENSNFITSISAKSNPIYINGKVAAISGEATFYFVDDIPTGNPKDNCPVLITATLQTSGFTYPKDSNVYTYSSFANSEVKTAILWQVNDIVPDRLKITENYLADIYPYKWQDIKIPFLISYHGDRSSKINGAETGTSGILFSYPATNTIGQLSSVNVELLSTDGFIIDEAPLYFKSTDSNGFNIGGYIFTTLTPLSVIDTTAIQATATVFTDVDTTLKTPFPVGYAPNAYAWISNPEQNTINKVLLVPSPSNCTTIQQYKDEQILADGFIKTVNVPGVSDLGTLNYTMSGFSGIYGMAIDPRNYNLVAADAELDRLYRFSSSGDITNVYDLSSIGDYTPTQKMFFQWTWTTPSPVVSASYYTLYSPNPVSTNSNNYILLVGGAIQPNNLIEIDPIRNAFKILVDPVYPPQNLRIDLIEIFSPQLPEKYISTLTNWVSTGLAGTTAFLLTGSPDLSIDPNRYIVSIDGVLQNSNTYTINNTTKTVMYSASLPADSTLQVLYIPSSIITPSNWIGTTTQLTSSINLSGESFINDSNSGILVNIGGAIQAPNSYELDYINRNVNFTSSISANIPYSITQYSTIENVKRYPAYTPSSITLDSNSNIWVTLFNAVSVLKFDSNFNLLKGIAPDNVKWLARNNTVNPDNIDYQSSQFGNTLTPLTTADYYVNEFFLKPPALETDKNDNVWVTYANPLCSMLVKYDNIGNLLTTVTLDQYSVPVSLVINSENNIWVANSYNTSLTGGSLQLFSSTGTLLSAVTGITHPGYLAVDNNDNVWFTHGIRDIGYVTTNGNTFSWRISADNDYIISNTLSTANIKDDEELGGLSVDVYNRVWVIDSIKNKAYIFPSSTTIDNNNVRTVLIRPNAPINYQLDRVNSNTIKDVVGDYKYKSAQAAGDWTGNHWYQKYANISNVLSATITGTSTPFSVSNFANTNEIFRINENFNNADYLKQLALPENLKQNTVLFDSFFSAAVGNATLSANQDLGQTVYERIANFVYNHSDVDTCNTEQLISLANLTNTSSVNYGSEYPTDIQKYIDISSVPKTKLWGIKSPVPVIEESLGNELNTQTAILTAGTKIILKSKFDSSLTLYIVPTLLNVPASAAYVYPLSSLLGVGFVQPVTKNYFFYDFNPFYTDTFVENLIDWENPNTTLSPYTSSTQEWYGNNGIIERTFNYLLTKNLFVK